MASGQVFLQFIDYLNALPENERQAKVDSFMNAGYSFPFTENDTLVAFVYQENAQTATIAGDATGWEPNLMMELITGTDFWYRQTTYENDARLDYKFVINGNNWILDPLNPYSCTGGYGPNSELRMPGYTLPPEIEYNPSIPHGTIKDSLFTSSNLGNSRIVTVYLPPGYDTTTHNYPVILFHDGPDYINLGDTRNILDYLIANSEIVPVIGVFVPPVNRTQEYAGSLKEPFRKFIIEELMPVFDAQYRIKTDPRNRAIIGASNGGNISLYIGMKNPESFGKIGAQSSNVQSEISNTFAGSDKMDIELYLDMGKYDIPLLIPLVENLVEILESKEYEHQYFWFHEGHSWGNWKGHLRLPLVQFFPLNTGINFQSFQPGFELEKIYPNPFSDHATITFSVPPGKEAMLVLQDMKGNALDTLISCRFAQQDQQFVLRNTRYPAGNYILSLIVGNAKTSMIITILD